MDFKQIEAFVNVVKYKSFSKAADATFFTQPTISTHISVLEKELGTRLLDRKGRTVEMTAQGRKFYKYAIEMVNTRARAIQDLGDNNDDVDGILEVQTSTVPGIVAVPDLMAGFRSKHDKARFYVEMSDSQTVIDNLMERKGDVGFVGEKQSNAAISYTEIFRDKVVLLAPESFNIEGDKITLEDAVQYPFIWRESGSATRKSFEDEAIKMGFDKTSFDVVARMNDLDSLIRSVAMGLGVSVLSAKTVDCFEMDGVKAYEIEGYKKDRTFYMVHLKDAALSPVADSFIKYVKKEKKSRAN